MRNMAGKFVRTIVGLSMASGLVGTLYAQSITTTITGKLGPITAGSGSVVSGTYVSGLTAVGTSGQTCELSIMGAGSGATATVALNNTNSIGANTGLKMIDWGTGYTTAPTQAVAISGGTATSCSGTATITSTINDPLDLNNATFTATITGLQAANVTYNPTSITYNGVSLTLTAGTVSLNPACSSASVTIAVPSGSGNDTLSLSNCNISGIVQGQFSSIISLPAGSIPAPIPMAFHAGVVNSPATASTATYVLDTSDSPPASTTLGITGGVTATCVSCPSMTLSPAAGSTITLNAITGGTPTPAPVTVSTGSTVLAYAVSTKSTGNWLTVNNASTTGGSTGGSFNVSATALSTPGTYTGTLTVFTAASNSPETINVSYVVSPPPPTFSVSPTGPLTFTATNGALPAGQNVTLSSSGAAITYTASPSTTSGGAWLSVSPLSGSTATGTETISINSAALSALAAGTYSGSVTFTATSSSANPTVTVNVTLVVTASLVPNPTSVSFNYTIGGTQPASIPVSIGSTGPAVPFTASVTSGNSWLSVAQNGSSTPASLTVSVNTSGVTAQTYTGTIQLTSGVASTVNIPVTFTVTQLSASPTLLTFAAVTGSNPNPNFQSVSVTSANGSLAFTAAAATTSGGNWLSVSPTSGSTPGNLTVTVTSASLADQSQPYQGTVTITAGGASVVVNVQLTVGADVLNTSPSSLTFTYQIGSPAPAAQSLQVTTTTAGSTFTAAPSSGATWLSIAPPAGGTTPGTLSVSINTSGLSAKTYTGYVVVTDADASNASSPPYYQVPVTLTVTPAPPLTATPSSVSFTYQPGGSAPANQTVALAIGSDAVTFAAAAATTTGGNWLAVSPTSGTTPQSITLSVQNYSSLAPGVYNGSVTVTPVVSNPVTIPVTLTVSTLNVSPATLSFSYTTGAAAPPGQSIAISTTSGSAVPFTASTATTSGGNWLQISAKSGTTPTTLLATIATSGLTAGTYNGTITVAATGYTSQTVAVTLTVSKPQATIQISGNLIFVLANTSAPATNTLGISASDGSAQAFSIAISGTNTSWLTVSPSSGTTPANVKVTANPSGLIPGVYVAQFTVTEAALPIPTKTVTAQLTVTGSNLTANPNTVTFTYQPGTSLPAAQVVALTLTSGSGTIALTGVTTNVSWLNAIATGTSAPTTINVSISPGLLGAGTYEGDVIVNGQGAPGTALQIPVTLTVNALPALTATPAALTFNYQVGGAAPPAQSFALAAGTAALNYTATSPGNWVQLNPVRGTTPGSVLVTVDPTGLAAGSYTGTITATAIGASNPVSVAVTLNVTGRTQPLTITASHLFFVAPTGGTAPASQMLTVNSTSSTPVSFTASSPVPWLTVSPASGTTPATLTVAVNPTGLASGTYSSSINVMPSGASTAQPVAVTLQVTSSTTIPTITGIINAASGVIGKVSPGMAISIFGQNLGPQTGVVFAAPADGGAIATTLGGTQVTFDGTAVPLLYSQNGQVNAIVPFEVANKASTEMQVTYNGVSSTGQTIPVLAAQPGLFTANDSGSGQGAILNQDYSVNSSSNPAAAGTAIMIYGTGGGATNPPSVDGALNPNTSTGALVATTTVSVNGQQQTPLYAGPAPDLLSGIIQVNAMIPEGTPSGAIPVVVTIGGVASQTVTVAVK